VATRMSTPAARRRCCAASGTPPNWDGLRLDRGREGIALGCDRIEQRRQKAEIGRTGQGWVFLGPKPHIAGRPYERPHRGGRRPARRGLSDGAVDKDRPQFRRQRRDLTRHDHAARMASPNAAPHKYCFVPTRSRFIQVSEITHLHTGRQMCKIRRRLFYTGC
jgi:hypothetical protein